MADKRPRNELGYLEDSTLREVITKDGRHGVMPAWLAEVTEEAGMTRDVTEERERR